MSRIVLFLLLLVLPVLSAAQSDGPIRRPEIRVGDSWTYRTVNLIDQRTDEYEERVGFVDDKSILLTAKRKSDGKEFDASYTPEWNAVVSLTGIIHRPHSGSFRFPIRVGDQHDSRFDTLRPRVHGVATVTTITSKVAGWETVEVPAGRIRAIRIEMEGVIRPVGDSKSYPQQVTAWYSPEVRRWVKFASLNPFTKFRAELVTYKLNEN